MSTPLSQLIEERDISPRVIALLQRNLLDLLSYLENPIILKPSNILISPDRRSVIIDNADTCDEASESEMIKSYGAILLAANNASATPNKKITTFSQKCIDGRLTNISEVQLSTERRISNTIYVPILIICAILITILAWLNNQ